MEPRVKDSVQVPISYEDQCFDLPRLRCKKLGSMGWQLSNVFSCQSASIENSARQSLFVLCCFGGFCSRFVGLASQMQHMPSVRLPTFRPFTVFGQKLALESVERKLLINDLSKAPKPICLLNQVVYTEL